MCYACEMGTADRPEIVDAEFEVVTPATDYAAPWWRGAIIIPIPNAILVFGGLILFTVAGFWSGQTAALRAEQACSQLAEEHRLDAAWKPLPACEHAPRRP